MVVESAKSVNVGKISYYVNRRQKSFLRTNWSPPPPITNFGYAHEARHDDILCAISLFRDLFAMKGLSAPFTRKVC